MFMLGKHCRIQPRHLTALLQGSFWGGSEGSDGKIVRAAVSMMSAYEGGEWDPALNANPMGALQRGRFHFANLHGAPSVSLARTF